MSFGKIFATVFFSLLALDAVWLTLRMQYHKSLFYSVQKAPLTLRWLPAVVVYLLLAFAITWVTQKNAKTLQQAILYGGTVGAIMYGFYDATNYATLSGWTLEMAITDTLWGAVASATAATVPFLLVKS